MLPCIFGLSGPVLTPEERAFFREAEPAGYLLFRRNCLDRAQLRALTDELRALSGRERLPILIDQEGGRIVRLGPPGWPAFPAAARFGALYARAPISAIEAARMNGRAIGIILAEAGISVACAPVLDLHHAEGHCVIGDRAFGADPLSVAALGRAMIEGLEEGGVAGAIKHMPGHGRARADSHRLLPVVDALAEALEADLAPFRKVAGRARIGMTAHILYQAWDAQRPATLSPTVVGEVIRGSIGFDGLLITDDIVMDALSGSMEARAAAALAAGCDLVLHGSGRIEEARVIAAALPPITDAARGRLERALPEEAGSAPTDLEECLAKWDALLALA